MAKNKPPVPVCMAFLTFRTMAFDPNREEDVFFGLPRAYWTRNYPSAFPLSFLIRCTSAHGDYSVEVQMQNSEGEVAWKDGPAILWPMHDPLEMYDLKINANVVFPAPGIYQFVLVLNREEVSRQRFHAKVAEVPTQNS